MLNRLRNLEQNFSISKAAVIVGFFTLMAKLVALARDSLLAGKFGSGDILDVYYAAFRVPDFLFNLLILGTLSVAFIPIFTEWLKKDEEKAYRIASSVLNITLLGIAIVCAVLYACAGPLTRALVPGFSGDKLIDTVHLTRLFLLSPIIFTVSNIFSCILNSQKKFLVVSLAPILYNIGIIFGLYFLYPKFGLFGLGLGVIVGACAHVAIQIPEAIRLGYRWMPIFDWKEPALKKLAKLFLPRIIGIDNSQISLIIGTTVGSILAAGSVTIFSFANNLQAVPLGIFAFSFSSAVFPVFSEFYADGNETRFIQTLSRTMSQILFFIIPISILMLIFRAYIVRLTLGHGHFDWNDTIATYTTLGIFTFSLISQAVAPLLSKAYYARHNTITPVIINVFSMIVNAILSYTWGKAYGVTGIAAGFTVSSLVNALLLFGFLRHEFHKLPELVQKFDSTLVNEILKIVAASIIMGAISYGCVYLFAPLVDTSTVIGILIQSGLAVTMGILGFFAVAIWLKLDHVNSIVNFFKRMTGKAATNKPA